jgi:hypothetical protein
MPAPDVPHRDVDGVAGLAVLGGVEGRGGVALRVVFGRIVVSEIETPIILVNLV